MKKYIKPTMKLLEIESEGMMVAISNTNAKEDACANEYSGCFVWDDEDYSSESTGSNPNAFDE
ncbi:hypothetical protein [uncultured Prevotella sp.]|uniref:hypothetical protein n=1 Tax=uncultured Prevotella sp. TaxID=159272 RepID=UPI0027E2816C|nr:hypothetical protein [uncultured Prevotella sp.]